jgi:uroporphyrinogen decarboxylase
MVTMTHIERVIAAMNFEEPDMVPIDVSFMDVIHMERVTGKKAYGAKSGAVIGATGETGEVDYNTMIMTNQKLENEARQKMDLDFLVVSDYKVFPEGYSHNFIDATTYVDLWGKQYKIKADAKTTWWVDGTIQTPEDLDKLKERFPSPNEFNYDIVDLTVEEAEKTDYPVLAWIHQGMMFPYLMIGGINKMVMALYRQPDFAKDLIKFVGDTNYEITKRILDRGKKQIVLVADSDDIAGKMPFYPPKMLKEFYLPYLERVVAEAHSRGMKYFKHSDGNLYPYLDMFVDIGVDGLHPLEVPYMSMADMKQHPKYKDKFFLRGNVDCGEILIRGTEEQVRADVRRCVDEAAKGGGFILADSNSLHSVVNTQNALWFFDEGRKYGRKGVGY